MSFLPHLWQRFDEAGTPIYLRGDRPTWFVPNRAGDRILQTLAAGREVCDEPSVRRFLERLPDLPTMSYPGRAALLSADHLRELWFHVTNRCNLSCSHCMFTSGPCDGAELPAERVLQLAEQALALGCRVFALTGGEPLMHRGFHTIVRGLLAPGTTRVVVLTNGLLLRRAFSAVDLDFDRLHLQVSVDGLQAAHDQLRGAGTFASLTGQLQWLKARGIPFTVSMCVTAANLADMPGVVDYAADLGAGNLHFMWYFVRGRGADDGFAPPDRIFQALVAADERARFRGLAIDNLDALKSQIFAPSGTIYDGSNGAWESAAVGPDGRLYPSAALVGVTDLASGLKGGLAAAWRDSPVLHRIRAATAADLSSPWRFLLGGGDLDHSYLGCRSFIGADPYLPLYEKLACWQIAREAAHQDDDGPPRLRLKMGDILESCGAGGAVALVHSNCLLSLAHQDSRSVVRDFYREAAEEVREDILNPVCYAEELISHIPHQYRFRGYGCGSPVLDAALRPGERVVDLGCGRGIECFIAARQVGPSGGVTGIDMLDNMLEMARRGAGEVAQHLGYDNLAFQRGFLEQMPLEDRSADVVLSNCVMNLSVHKRKAFKEIFRVLDGGGRLVMADVVCDDEPDPAIRNDEALRGECIAGAMTQKDLVGLLEESGFIGIRLIKRFPYRIVRGHPFFSLTFEAFKPAPAETVRVIYRGPFAGAVTSEGQLLVPGLVQELPRHQADLFGEALFVLDGQGAVANLDPGENCCCALPPQTGMEPGASPEASGPFRHASGCLLCGAPLRYLKGEESRTCSCCQKTFNASAVCEQGHFVCDDCHAADASQLIEKLCLASRETDLLQLFDRIRSRLKLPVNGPEYHALVPGVILATYRNLGGEVSEEDIRTGILRGTRVTGGSCAFWGVCGAAAGVGIAFSLLLEANPLKGGARQAVQESVQKVLAEIAGIPAARCCQRDCWIALRKAAELSGKMLPLALQAVERPLCRQQHLNRECAAGVCPWAPEGLGARG
jgi:MoaA/NifB/PqqE/SkfB family radical SAM enzyme/SAM-dependent methyltransferase